MLIRLNMVYVIVRENNYGYIFINSIYKYN